MVLFLCFNPKIKNQCTWLIKSCEDSTTWMKSNLTCLSSATCKMDPIHSLRLIHSKQPEGMTSPAKHCEEHFTNNPKTWRKQHLCGLFRDVTCVLANLLIFLKNNKIILKNSIKKEPGFVWWPEAQSTVDGFYYVTGRLCIHCSDGYSHLECSAVTRTYRGSVSIIVHGGMANAYGVLPCCVGLWYTYPSVWTTACQWVLMF